MDLSVPVASSDRSCAVWARAMALALHLAVLACLLDASPPAGDDGGDMAWMAEIVSQDIPEPVPEAVAVEVKSQPAPRPPERLQPNDRPTRPTLGRHRAKAPTKPNSSAEASASGGEAHEEYPPATSAPPPSAGSESGGEREGMKAGSTAEATDYARAVWDRITRRKPARVRTPGTVSVRFSIDKAGSLVGAEITGPSGTSALDRLALDVLGRAAPFPPPPSGVAAPLEFNISFQFR